MSALNLIYPMFAMVLLTVVVLVTLFRRRVRAVREGAVSSRYFRIYQGDSEPEVSASAARHFVNLFEAPVLFYAGCVTAIAANQGGTLLISLAWLYVVARGLHALVHIGRNRLRSRIAAYFSSWLVLLAFWIGLVVLIAQRGT